VKGALKTHKWKKGAGKVGAAEAEGQQGVCVYFLTAYQQKGLLQGDRWFGRRAAGNRAMYAVLVLLSACTRRLTGQQQAWAPCADRLCCAVLC
jgi:hypothetical protein